VVGKAGFEYRRARLIEAVSLLCASERAKQNVLPPQGRVHGGPKPRVVMPSECVLQAFGDGAEAVRVFDGP
jgi:hypothetical protein